MIGYYWNCILADSIKLNFLMKITQTNDGSKTLYRKDINEHYHSIHGARNESEHVFIRNGLDQFKDSKKTIKILEMGFGTGLNALLSMKWAKDHQRNVHFTTLENKPLSYELIGDMGYTTLDGLQGFDDAFRNIHESIWSENQQIQSNFSLEKLNEDLTTYVPSRQFDLVFFDAFSPDKQPELWEIPVFEKMYQLLSSPGIMVTYCAKGYVRRNMIAAGFEVERLPGPPGKREMLRSRK